MGCVGMLCIGFCMVENITVETVVEAQIFVYRLVLVIDATGVGLAMAFECKMLM